MARKNPARDAALAQAKARQRAAGQKVSRLERSGVHVRAAGLDPRRSTNELAAMSTQQLRAYTRRLDAFTSRSNGYVAGLNGSPITSATWREYKRAEAQHNANAQSFYDRIKTLSIPGMNQTIGDRQNDLSQSRRRARGDFGTFTELNRTAGNIVGQDKLETLLRQMNGKIDPNYLAREARGQRNVIRKMLEITSNHDLDSMIARLNDEEVITLVGYTDFMKTLESSYAMAKSTSTDTPRWQSQVYEDNEEKIRELANWASRHFDQDIDAHDEPTSRRANGTRRVSFTPGRGTFNPIIDGASGIRTAPTRDRYGRFVRADTANPEPRFNRDASGRFTPGRGKFNPKL